ncbi:uncharacterized protein HMPREF1541_05571 [Cyphellophora europaea CBS 101466]|uniref:Uncharacterized protein n=1 Tax=Cyphellophora europaea (strain CBS 101466) TaxID=1220924 RepID=W2RUA1_CYPE1|nr:uncharacterized protein HMPREF1541_05571 [Cyphellophora europaea CBS 101466]ETN39348.1 hypothetical protein HMPREF1541_05571 [Cyphellophora europaea CBS 101466]
MTTKRLMIYLLAFSSIRNRLRQKTAASLRSAPR